jgi:hypothetical protein
LLSIVGHNLLHVASHASSDTQEKNRGGSLAFLGLILLVFGWVGELFSKIMQATISRQREFLADATAVELTRNPNGIAGALKKAGSPNVGSRIENRHAIEASHLFFGDIGIFSFFGLLATHPDIATRIKRLDPHFDGRFLEQITPVEKDIAGQTPVLFPAVPPPVTQPVPLPPYNEEFRKNAYHEIQAKALKEMIRRTTFLADFANQKSGVCFEIVKDDISAVATDGLRLAWQIGSVQCVNDHKVEQAIVPVQTLQKLEQALSDKSIDKDDKVKMAVDDGSVWFNCKHITLVSRVIDGRFPKWRNIIPKTDDDAPATIECATLLNAILQAEFSTSDLKSGVTFTFDKGKLTLEGSGQVPISYDGEKRTIKLDPKFLVSFIRVLDSNTLLSIYPPPKNNPIKFTADDGSYIYVVMPFSGS